MISEILRLLNSGDFLDTHEYIEIAKGKYKIETDLRKIYTQQKRAAKWRWKKQ